MVDDKHNQIKARIEKSADRYVFNYGVRGWNMDDCAKEAGITKRTLYRYVNSKEDLIKKVLTRLILTTQKNLIRVMESEEDYLSGLNKVARIYPHMMMKMNTTVIQNVFKEYPDIEKYIIEKRLNLAAKSLSYIKNGQTLGFLKKEFDPQTLLEMLQSLVIYYMKNNPLEIEKKLSESLSLVLNGIIDRR